MDKPIIELENIEHSPALSEETPAFTAGLLIDGKRVGSVRNSGQGGAHFYDTTLSHGDIRNLDERIRATYPPTPSSAGPLDETLDSLISGLVLDDTLRKDLVRLMAERILVLHDGGVRQTKGTDVPIEEVRKDFPGAIILNELAIEDAVAAVRRELL